MTSTFHCVMFYFKFKFEDRLCDMNKLRVSVFGELTAIGTQTKRQTETTGNNLQYLQLTLI